MADEIRIRANILEGMILHARNEPEIECCGLLAGHDGLITEIIPTENVLASSTAYEIPPQELFRFFRRIREEGLDHLGHYHSHPRTENFPSERDITQACYPSEAYFIISPLIGAPRPVRAFLIRDGRVLELEITVV